MQHHLNLLKCSHYQYPPYYELMLLHWLHTFFVLRDVINIFITYLQFYKTFLYFNEANVQNDSRYENEQCWKTTFFSNCWPEVVRRQDHTAAVSQWMDHSWLPATRFVDLNIRIIYLYKFLYRQFSIKILVHLPENLLSSLLRSGFILGHFHHRPDLESASSVNLRTPLL